ncbi:MAG: SAM-dependent methyltransferase [Gammaproteobacteria bacterium]|nr:SAM-dependent methyltransferase [Gammaproteobacteria bacterium]
MHAKTAPPIYSVMLVSAAALAYEVLLMRLFSIVQWHHFAYMVISLALLGYGASGTFLSLMRDRLTASFHRSFIVNAALFSLSAVGCFLLAQQLPFNTLEMFWDPDQWLLLLLCYLLLLIPFFFAANCICLCFARFPDGISRIYAFDLIGAGLGALGVILALHFQSPLGVLRAIAILGLLAAALVSPGKGMLRPWLTSVPYLSLALLITLLPTNWMTVRLSEYKPLSQTLQIADTRVLEESSSPLGLLTLVESRFIPFRLAPGLSLLSSHEPPAQLGVFIDGESPMAISRYQGNRESLSYLDYQTSALPYHLRRPGRVLILGMGGGSTVLQASYHRAENIEAVEVNPQLVQLIRERYADYAGWNWLRQVTRIHESEARGFVAASDSRYGLIQISLLDSANAAAAGVHALNESYLYTQEAITEYLEHLEPDGLLSVTRWLKLPPRDGFKLLATATEALRHAGVKEPASRMLFIRGWGTSTLIVKNGEITKKDIQQLRHFCEARAFDLVHYPGISERQANRYNILAEPYFFQGAKALLGPDADAFIKHYKFDLKPATDDRPYFFNFFKWAILPEALPMYRQGGVSLLELGYPILVLTLIQATLVSLLLIILPLRFLRAEQNVGEKADKLRVMLYFLSIGVGFMFIEMAYIQKFILFLSHPIYAIAVILSGFLVFSGLGSLYGGRLARRNRPQGLGIVVILLGGTAVTYLWLLPHLFSVLADLSLAAKVSVTLLLIAPLSFCMGMPFPLGLSQVARQHPPLVPWAWGINGCASLIGAILASLLSIHLGFSWVILLAVGAYIGAVLSFPGPDHP